MIEPVLTISIPAVHPAEDLITREWLVTNGLGGYSSGTVAGVNARRHHGLFIPNLPAPHGRTMLLPLLAETVAVENEAVDLGGAEFLDGGIKAPGVSFLKEFRLDWQTPTWTFGIKGRILEKKILMPYGHNTVYVSYALREGPPVQLHLRPYGSCRKHDSPLGYPKERPVKVSFQDEHYEIFWFEGAPVLRLTVKPFKGFFVAEKNWLNNLHYRTEAHRGLDHVEDLFSPGFFSMELKEDECIYFVAGAEAWESLEEDPAEMFEAELRRRKKLVSMCEGAQDNLVTAQLTLAADQFIVLPRTRHDQNGLLLPTEQARTIIAGYHWFTDWGRDTMISLEGLTLCTGRKDEARAILQTFGRYVRRGLLPNHFPEGEKEAIYNTVDATFWYFHAIDRYIQLTGDQDILESLYAVLESIIGHHVRGTDFGIRMDPRDGLIEAAAEGYQLTWMDAKVEEWVVTPRRGKPVEIQALWFNALKLMETWGGLRKKSTELYADLSRQAAGSFNGRFWYEEGGYLYDVVDSDQGHDASLRPNQVLAISLRFPILDQRLWKPVVDIVEKKLLTPFGLRTLDPAHKDYHSRYEGSRWERDAAYHQGLVWTWLIGPFMDARHKVYQDPQKALDFFNAMEGHLKEAGIGTISEIFDGEPPYHPRGCIAQAWSVAEVLRCFSAGRNAFNERGAI